MNPQILVRYRIKKLEIKRELADYLFANWKEESVSLSVADNCGEHKSATEDEQAFAFDFDTGPVYFFTASMGDPGVEKDIVAYIGADDPYKIIVNDHRVLGSLIETLEGFSKVSKFNHQVLVETDLIMAPY